MTVRDLIKGSLRSLGVLASGEEPSAAEAQDALASLNSLLGSWRNERLMAYAVLPHSFDFVAGQKSYLIGPDGDWKMDRPARVQKVQLTYTQTGTSIPLNLPVQILDLDEYQRITVPDTASSIPQSCYIDDAYPARNILWYTVPSEVYSAVLFCWQVIAGFADLDAQITLPDGYERAMRYCLAIELASEYGTEPSATVVANAREAKATIKSYNMPCPKMQVDSAMIRPGTGAFNWLTGGYGQGVS